MNYHGPALPQGGKLPSLTTQKIKILFVAHEATRSGAPIVLLHTLRWLKNNTDIEFEVLFKKKGELINEFRSIAKVHIVRRTLPKRFVKNIGGLYSSLFQIPLSLLFKRFDLIFSNTITNGAIVEALVNKNNSCITHVHELDNVIAAFGEKNWKLISRQTNKFIAVSRAVANDLIGRNVPNHKIEIIPPCTNLSDLRDEVVVKIRNDLNIPEDAFVICGGGYVSWHKGTDLFIQLANYLIRSAPSKEIYFVWFGHFNESTKNQLLYDVQKLGCEGRVIFTGFVRNTAEYIKASNVFALTSRADSQPLVAIEAGMLGLPIVCFEGAGGTSEWVSNLAGFTVPYLNVAAMGDAILSLYEDQNLLLEKAKYAEEISRKMFDVSTVPHAIFELINATIRHKNKLPLEVVG